jgi:hypothetical protein
MNPELEKMAAVQDDSLLLSEFFEWMSSKGYFIAEYRENTRLLIPENELFAVDKKPDEIIADFFGIDLKKAEAEKRQLLKEIRQANKK